MKEENAKLREKIQELSKQIRARGSINKSEGKVFKDLAKFQEENEELKRGILEYSEKWRAKSKHVIHGNILIQAHTVIYLFCIVILFYFVTIK